MSAVHWTRDEPDLWSAALHDLTLEVVEVSVPATPPRPEYHAFVRGAAPLDWRVGVYTTLARAQRECVRFVDHWQARQP